MHSKVLPAGPTGSSDVQRSAIVDWWHQLQLGGDAGGTNWEVLDALSDRVTECLMQNPPALKKAATYTAKAMLLISGVEEH